MASSRLLRLALAGLLLGVAPGCFVFRSGFDSLSTDQKMRRAAKHAWERVEDQYEENPYDDEIEEGFRLGYREYVFTGCMQGPRTLPEKYMLPRYQTCFGRRGIQAFLQGYQLGVQAASADCGGLHGTKGPKKESSRSAFNRNSPCQCEKCQAKRAAMQPSQSCSTCANPMHSSAPSPMEWPVFEMTPFHSEIPTPTPVPHSSTTPTESAPAPNPVPEAVLPTPVPSAALEMPAPPAPASAAATSPPPGISTQGKAQPSSSTLPVTTSVPMAVLTDAEPRSEALPPTISLPQLQSPDLPSAPDPEDRWRPTRLPERTSPKVIPEAARPVENR